MQAFSERANVYSSDVRPHIAPSCTRTAHECWRLFSKACPAAEDTTTTTTTTKTAAAPPPTTNKQMENDERTRIQFHNVHLKFIHPDSYTEFRYPLVFCVRSCQLMRIYALTFDRMIHESRSARGTITTVNETEIGQRRWRRGREGGADELLFYLLGLLYHAVQLFHVIEKTHHIIFLHSHP